MKMEQLTRQTQQTIKALAEKRGLTPEQVLAHFDALFSRKKVSIHSPVFS